jgi:ABC-2 type transport system permease protein
VSRLFRSELLKVRTIRTFFWLALANIAVVLVTAIATAFSDNSFEADQDHRGVAQIAGISLVLALISGIIVMGGEARHGTITQTLLVTPLRERVVLVKAAVAALIGLALAVIAEGLVLLVTVPDSLDVHKAGGALLGILIGAPLAGALGVGLGAVVHAQGAAIGTSLAWLLIGESLLVPAISDSAQKYTPGWSFGALASGVRDGGDQVLGMVGGSIAAAVWTALFVVAGLFALLGRDV